MKMMKVAAIVVATLSLLVSSCNSARDISVPPETLSVGTAPLESSALVYIAQERGFFASNGLHVTIRDYDTGAAAFNGMLNDEVDVAIPAEYPLAGAAFSGQPVKALASIDEVRYFFLVARKDKGIGSIDDLKGKKIGVVQKTIAEFYLNRFLMLNGVTSDQVAIVNIPVASSQEALFSGAVDAIVGRPPYLEGITKGLGDNAAIWRVQSNQALYALLTARDDWIARRTDTIKRLLRALVQAESFLIQHPSEAKAIVSQKLNLSQSYMDEVWLQNEYALTLDQALIAALEDEARWMMGNKLTAETVVPDFARFIYADALEAVAPNSVNIIH